MNNPNHQLLVNKHSNAINESLRVLNPHQIDAVSATLEELKRIDRTKVVMACGTGKTLVWIEVARRIAPQTMIILVPSLALVKQTLDVWKQEMPAGYAKLLCVCSDESVAELDAQDVSVAAIEANVTTDPLEIIDFLINTSNRRVIFATYHSAPLLALVKDQIPRIELGIFDEAHRTAGNRFETFTTALYDDEIQIEKRVFLTATPKIYDYRKSTDLVEVCSMDNEELYGSTAYYLPFSEAIKRGIICDFRVIVTVITNDDLDATSLRIGHQTRGKKSTDTSIFACAIALRKAALVYDAKKIFTFHKSISDAKLFSTFANTLKAKINTERHLRALHINGKMKGLARTAVLSEFAEEEFAMLTNVRCLSEGVDVPTVDMVGFVSPRESHIDIVQTIGRVIRRSIGKTMGYLFIPLYVDIQAGESVEDSVNNSNFSTIWSVVEALREQDSDLDDALFTIRSKKGFDLMEKALGNSNEATKESISDLAENEILPRIQIDASHALLKVLRKSISTVVIDKLTASWSQMYGALQSYQMTFGNCDVPTLYVVGELELGAWVSAQRKIHKRKKLSTKNVELLNKLGFVWNSFDSIFNEMYQELVSFKKVNGHLVIPLSKTKLLNWCNQQRLKKRSENLTIDRIKKLKSIGFIWNPGRSGGKGKNLKLQGKEIWETFYKRYVRSKRHIGSGESIKTIQINGVSLEDWCRLQSKHRGTRLLSKRREVMLDNIKFPWEEY